MYRRIGIGKGAKSKRAPYVFNPSFEVPEPQPWELKTDVGSRLPPSQPLADIAGLAEPSTKRTLVDSEKVVIRNARVARNAADQAITLGVITFPLLLVLLFVVIKYA